MRDNLTKGKIIIGSVAFIIAYFIITLLFSLPEFATNFSVALLFRRLTYLWYIKAVIAACIGLITVLVMSSSSLDSIKSLRVGDGQYGTARWATDEEKFKMFTKVPFGREKSPGYVVGVDTKKEYWLVDTSDQNLLQVAPPGAGKTKFCIIPTLYYNALVHKNTGKGASLILTDCKGELYSVCAAMLQQHGYRTPFLDFRNTLRSYRFNLMYNVNKYIDKYKAAQTEEERLIAYGRAERYAKVLSESIVDNIDDAQKSEASQYFKETAKGLLTGIILLVSEYGGEDERHIISVFRLIIELNGLDEGSSDVMQRSKLEKLLTHVDNPRLINYVGPAMKADARTSMNVFSSALGKLVAFIDAELEQMVCGHSEELGDVDFIKYPTAIFLICPDENTTRHFFASLYIRYMMNDLIEQASHTKELRLSRDVLCIWDEFGNMPPVKNMDVLLTAARSRGIRFFISLQSFAQLEKNYSQRSAKILRGACQIKMYTYMADDDEAKALSEALGDMTVQSGSVSRSTRDGFWTDSSSQSVQMTKRRLMTPDEIMQIPQGEFILRKAGSVSARTHLELFWNYLKLYPEQKIDVRYELRPIQCLTSESIRRKARLKKNALTRGMFD